MIPIEDTPPVEDIRLHQGRWDFRDVRQSVISWPWISRRAHNRVVTAARFALDAALEYLDVAETALEAERQWRLTSLPALLAAEERAVKAEADVALWKAGLGLRPAQFPELRAVTRTSHLPCIAAAYHQSTDGERP